MSTAKIDQTGKLVQLDGATKNVPSLTDKDVKDPKTLARLLTGLFEDVAELKRRWVPRRVDFEDVAVAGGGAIVNLEHRLGGRVRWHVVGWTSTETPGPSLRENAADTTADVLSLQSYTTGTATIRVEEAG